MICRPQIRFLAFLAGPSTMLLAFAGIRWVQHKRCGPILRPMVSIQQFRRLWSRFEAASATGSKVTCAAIVRAALAKAREDSADRASVLEAQLRRVSRDVRNPSVSVEDLQKESS